MAGKLIRRDGSEGPPLEIFDLYLDPDDRRRLSEDPRGFLSNLLQEEGATMNALMLESDEKYKNGDDGGPLALEAWHIRSGPAKSGWVASLSCCK
jgi:hypothetical protein